MLPEPANEAETMEALSRIFAAEPASVAPDDPNGPDYGPRTAINIVTIHGLTVETIGGPLPL